MGIDQIMGSMRENDTLKFNEDNSAQPPCGGNQAAKGDRLKIYSRRSSRVQIPSPAS